MDCDDGIRMSLSELLCDRAPPIAAMRAKALIAQVLRHQARPKIADTERQSPLIRFIGESVAWDVRRHHVERGLRLPSEAGRVSEKRYELEEPVERIGIAVREDEPKTRRPFSA